MLLCACMVPKEYKNVVCSYSMEIYGEVGQKNDCRVRAHMR